MVFPAKSPRRIRQSLPNQTACFNWSCDFSLTRVQISSTIFSGVCHAILDYRIYIAIVSKLPTAFFL